MEEKTMTTVQLFDFNGQLVTSADIDIPIAGCFPIVLTFNGRFFKWDAYTTNYTEVCGLALVDQAIARLFQDAQKT